MQNSQLDVHFNILHIYIILCRVFCHWSWTTFDSTEQDVLKSRNFYCVLKSTNGDYDKEINKLSITPCEIHFSYEKCFVVVFFRNKPEHTCGGLRFLSGTVFIFVLFRPNYYFQIPTLHLITTVPACLGLDFCVCASHSALNSGLL